MLVIAFGERSPNAHGVEQFSSHDFRTVWGIEELISVRGKRAGWGKAVT